MPALIILGLFLISPIFSILAAAFFAWSSPRDNRTHILLFCIAFSLYFGLLNTTKVLDSDLEQYYQYYMNAGTLGLFEYLKFYDHEPCYYFLSWFCYHLFAGNWSLYMLFLTAFEYILLSICVLRFAQLFKLENKDILTALTVMFLYFQLFSISAHLVRQMLATSMAFLFLTDYHLCGKKRWALALASLLVHTTVLPILFLGVLPINRTRFKLRTLLMIFGILAVCVFSFLYLIPILDRLISIPIFSIISYFNSRIGNSSLLTDFGRVEAFNLACLVFIGIFVVIVSIIALRQYYRLSLVHQNNSSKIKLCIQRVKENPTNKKTGFTLYLSFVLAVFVLACNYSGIGYLAERYTFFLYSLLGIILVQFIATSRLLKTDAARIAVAVGMVAYFIIYFSHGVFAYESLGDALTRPAFLYFF